MNTQHPFRPATSLFSVLALFALLCLGFSATANAGPFLYYSFEGPDTTGDGLVTDASGNGRDGTLSSYGTGSCAYVIDSPTALGSQSLRLSETSNSNAASLTRYISTSDLNFSAGDWTWTGWFKRADIDTNDMIFHVGSGDGFGGENETYVYAPGGATTVSAQHYPSPTFSLTTSSVSDGDWYHATLVRDTANNQVRFYIDGQLVGSAADSGFSMIQSTTYPVAFGAQAGGTRERNLDGWLDDVAIWDSVLTDPVIRGIADGVYTPATAPESLHYQAAGLDHVIFQAEDYDSVSGSAPWEVITSSSTRATVDAAGGEAVVSPEDGVSGGDHSTTLTYALVFEQAGTYTMYLRGSMFDDEDLVPPTNYGGEDSFYRSSAGTGTAFGSANPGITENGYLNASKWMLGDVPTEGRYNWWTTNPTYTVSASDAGKAILFEVDNREGNFSIDAIVFSTESGLRWAQLNGLAGLTDKPYFEDLSGDPRSIGYSATGETASGASGGPIWSKHSDAGSTTDNFAGVGGDYWYGQQMNGGNRTLTLNPLFVQSLLEDNALRISVDLAASESPPGGWEADDLLLVELDKNHDGTFETLLARFYGNGGLGRMVLTGDPSVQLTEQFARFWFDVPNDATEMVLRFTGISSAADEAIGIANIQLVVPEPSTFAMLLGGIGLLGYLRRRRRS